MHVPDLLDPLTGYVLDWLDADLKIKELEERKAKLGAEMLAVLKPGEQIRLPSGQGVVLQAGARRFDPELAKEILPPVLLASISRTEPSARRAQQMLSPEIYDQCRKPAGDPYLKRLS